MNEYNPRNLRITTDEWRRANVSMNKVESSTRVVHP
jgi:hypothetical protein